MVGALVLPFKEDWWFTIAVQRTEQQGETGAVPEESGLLRRAVAADARLFLFGDEFGSGFRDERGERTEMTLGLA